VKTINKEHILETLVILDYGSQYTQLIARRAREMGVFSIILPFKTTALEISKHNPRGVVLSGGPNSVFDKDAPGMDEAILSLNLPILGICYGQQLLAQRLAAKLKTHLSASTAKPH
jgi:GMP synthase (glutamine-hydrolysing)